MSALLDAAEELAAAAGLQTLRAADEAHALAGLGRCALAGPRPAQ